MKIMFLLLLPIFSIVQETSIVGIEVIKDNIKPLSSSYQVKNAKITIYNKTGYELDSLYVGDYYVGKLTKNEHLAINFSGKLEMKDGMPFGNPKAQPIAIISEKGHIEFCGTGAYYLMEGNYAFDIIIDENKYRYYLLWQNHLTEKVSEK